MDETRVSYGLCLDELAECVCVTRVCVCHACVCVTRASSLTDCEEALPAALPAVKVGIVCVDYSRIFIGSEISRETKEIVETDASDAPLGGGPASGCSVAPWMLGWRALPPQSPDAAARKIQAAARRHHTTPALKRWPTLVELRAAFLDADAEAAGACSSDWYTDTMLLERDLLRQHPVVIAALKEAFEMLLSPGSTKLSKEAYFTVGRRVYLRSCLQTGDADIDAQECLAELRRDYAKDCGADGELDWEQFRDSWFELVRAPLDRPVLPPVTTPHWAE